MVICLLAISIFSGTPVSAANGSEFWECGSYTGASAIYASRTLFMTVNADRKSGEIRVAGEVFEAVFGVEGINRRWDWANNRFSLLLRPDGRASYYDFNRADSDGLAKSQMILPCRRVTLDNRLQELDFDSLLTLPQ